MVTLNEMKAEMLIGYQKEFEVYEKIAFMLYELGDEELQNQIIKKMAELSLLINHCKESAKQNILNPIK